MNNLNSNNVDIKFNNIDILETIRYWYKLGKKYCKVTREAIPLNENTNLINSQNNSNQNNSNENNIDQNNSNNEKNYVSYIDRQEELMDKYYLKFISEILKSQKANFIIDISKLENSVIKLYKRLHSKKINNVNNQTIKNLIIEELKNKYNIIFNENLIIDNFDIVEDILIKLEFIKYQNGMKENKKLIQDINFIEKKFYEIEINSNISSYPISRIIDNFKVVDFPQQTNFEKINLLKKQYNEIKLQFISLNKSSKLSKNNNTQRHNVNNSERLDITSLKKTLLQVKKKILPEYIHLKDNNIFNIRNNYSSEQEFHQNFIIINQLFSNLKKLLNIENSDIEKSENFIDIKNCNKENIKQIQTLNEELIKYIGPFSDKLERYLSVERRIQDTHNSVAKSVLEILELQIDIEVKYSKYSKYINQNNTKLFTKFKDTFNKFIAAIQNMKQQILKQSTSDSEWNTLKVKIKQQTNYEQNIEKIKEILNFKKLNINLNIEKSLILSIEKHQKEFIDSYNVIDNLFETLKPKYIEILTKLLKIETEINSIYISYKNDWNKSDVDEKYKNLNEMINLVKKKTFLNNLINVKSNTIIESINVEKINIKYPNIDNLISEVNTIEQKKEEFKNKIEIYNQNIHFVENEENVYIHKLREIIKMNKVINSKYNTYKKELNSSSKLESLYIYIKKIRGIDNNLWEKLDAIYSELIDLINKFKKYAIKINSLNSFQNNLESKTNSQLKKTLRMWNIRMSDTGNSPESMGERIYSDIIQLEKKFNAIISEIDEYTVNEQELEKKKKDYTQYFKQIFPDLEETKIKDLVNQRIILEEKCISLNKLKDKEREEATVTKIRNLFDKFSSDNVRASKSQDPTFEDIESINNINIDTIDESNLTDKDKSNNKIMILINNLLESRNLNNGIDECRNLINISDISITNNNTLKTNILQKYGTNNKLDIGAKIHLQIIYLCILDLMVYYGFNLNNEEKISKYITILNTVLRQLYNKFQNNYEIFNKNIQLYLTKNLINKKKGKLDDKSVDAFNEEQFIDYLHKWCFLVFIKTMNLSNIRIYNSNASRNLSTTTKSAKTGSAKTGSAKTGSVRTGSAKTGSAKTGSAKTGSVRTGSAKTGSSIEVSTLNSQNINTKVKLLEKKTLETNIDKSITILKNLDLINFIIEFNNNTIVNYMKTVGARKDYFQNINSTRISNNFIINCSKIEKTLNSEEFKELYIKKSELLLPIFKTIFTDDSINAKLKTENENQYLGGNTSNSKLSKLNIFSVFATTSMTSSSIGIVGKALNALSITTFSSGLSTVLGIPFTIFSSLLILKYLCKNVGGNDSNYNSIKTICKTPDLAYYTLKFLLKNFKILLGATAVAALTYLLGSQNILSLLSIIFSASSFVSILLLIMFFSLDCKLNNGRLMKLILNESRKNKICSICNNFTDKLIDVSYKLSKNTLLYLLKLGELSLSLGTGIGKTLNILFTQLSKNVRDRYKLGTKLRDAGREFRQNERIKAKTPFKSTKYSRFKNTMSNIKNFGEGFVYGENLCNKKKMQSQKLERYIDNYTQKLTTFKEKPSPTFMEKNLILLKQKNLQRLKKNKQRINTEILYKCPRNNI